jgi:cystathionine beta-lyase
MNPGITFGRNGSGFMRLNIATPRHKLAEAMEKIKQALN